MCEREVDLLPLTCPELGTWPETQACALTGNPTRDPLLLRLALNPLSHTSQGWSFDLFFYLGHISLSWHMCYVVLGGALSIH